MVVKSQASGKQNHEFTVTSKAKNFSANLSLEIKAAPNTIIPWLI